MLEKLHMSQLPATGRTTPVRELPKLGVPYWGPFEGARICVNPHVSQQETRLQMTEQTILQLALARPLLALSLLELGNASRVLARRTVLVEHYTDTGIENIRIYEKNTFIEEQTDT